VIVMNRSTRIAGIAAAGLIAAGCSDFLPSVGQNPNQPTEAAAQVLFIGAQGQAFLRHQGQLARTAGMLTQQLSGINNQQLNWVSQWLGNEGDYNFQMQGFYTGGGLVDWRLIQQATNASGNSVFEGIAKVWEAYTMGTAASIWGDIPYREAVSDIQHPRLDPQEQVYGDLLALLDEGIALINSGVGAGPGSHDLVYGGDRGRWVRAANTLKARYHLHLVEREGNARYQQALTAALAGINEHPGSIANAVHGQGPGDFRARHSASLENGNIWAQFLRARQDIVAGRRLVDILKARDGDPRLAGYFLPMTSGDSAGRFTGANQFGQGSGSLLNNVSGGSGRAAYDFRQPMITWSENQLIIAEAKHQLGDPTAISHLNAVRGAVGLPPLAGPITLADIMTEKYIVMFQNIEAWNDYKRTCLPALVPGGVPQLAEVPGRLPYGRQEREQNPNIHAPESYPGNWTTGSAPLRNWNDPQPCPVPAS
jgi:hypothetical protein